MFAIYAFLPSVALSAMPVHFTPVADPVTHSHYTSALAGEFAGDPVAGIVQNMGLGPLTQPMAYYVGLLAGTILIIATNAGIIGVSRLTYSMGVHRQFPDILRTVHPKYRTPWVAIVIYSVLAILMMIPASQSDSGVAFLGNLYAFGAMLSFTVAHASVIALQNPKPRSRPALGRHSTSGSARSTSRSSPSSAAWGRSEHSWAAWETGPHVRYAGIAWLVLGMIVYVVYRKSQGLPLTEGTCGHRPR